MLDAHHALREVAESPVVPFRFKRPLIVNFLYGKISTERLLPVMTAYDKIRVHAIATSKPLAEPPKKIVLKRRHAAAAEAPVCSRLSDTHVLVGVPKEGPDTRWKFGFSKGGLRRVADDKEKKGRKSKKTSAPTLFAAGADVTPLDLPSDVSAYDRRPWVRVRDLIAQAHFRAEEMRAAEEQTPFDIERASSHMETNPFEWDCTHRPFLHKFLFIVWTTGEKKQHLKYHLNIYLGNRLCAKAGILRARLASKRGAQK